MKHQYLERLKESNPALRLLNADNMPLIISFLHHMFVETNQRSLSCSELESRLGDYLYQLREIYGEARYPRSAKAYLEEWARGENAFLRKYYTPLSDEPEFDLSPGAEKAMEWLKSLEERHFIGTESRLLTVFQLLREIVSKTNQDPAQRIRELEEKRAAIDAEIEKIESQGLAPHDPTQIKERFFQLEDTARRLLSDFRQVESNFRTLDQETRERIATSDKAKGELLDEIFSDQDVIWDSDQGRSFTAFWEFLMSPSRQGELTELLEKVFLLDEVRQLAPDPFLSRIKFYLLEAGEKVYKTNNLLVEQLRKFLDNQAWLENRRIMELIREIEKSAIEVKANAPGDKVFATLDETRPHLEIVMNRTLFTPPINPVIDETSLTAGTADMDVDVLYSQNHIDEEKLRANIRKALCTASQISLAGVIEHFPVEKGLAEAVAYLKIASNDEKALIDEKACEIILISGDGDKAKTVKMPLIIFVR